MKILKILNLTLPFLFWFFMIFAFDSVSLGIMTLLAAAIHELGHIFFGISEGRLSLISHPSGFRIKRSGIASYTKEIFFILGGAIFNTGAAIILFILSAHIDRGDYFSLLATVNLFTAASNLLPISGYDGYRFLSTIISSGCKNERRAHEALECVSFSLSTVLLFLALFFILKTGEGYWIFAVLFVPFILWLRKLSDSGNF